MPKLALDANGQGKPVDVNATLLEKHEQHFQLWLARRGFAPKAQAEENVLERESGLTRSVE